MIKAAEPADPADQIDVRRIVLGVISDNDQARDAYRTDPAMRLGVEVVIGTLGRLAVEMQSAEVFTRDELEQLVHRVAVACSLSGGPENEQTIGDANTELFPTAAEVAADDDDVADQTTDVTTTVTLAVMDRTFRHNTSTSGITPAGHRALVGALAEAGFEIVSGPTRATKTRA
jgi:hypothetical protein